MRSHGFKVSLAGLLMKSFTFNVCLADDPICMNTSTKCLTSAHVSHLDGLTQSRVFRWRSKRMRVVSEREWIEIKTICQTTNYIVSPWIRVCEMMSSDYCVCRWWEDETSDETMYRVCDTHIDVEGRNRTISSGWLMRQDHQWSESQCEQEANATDDRISVMKYLVLEFVDVIQTSACTMH